MPVSDSASSAEILRRFCRARDGAIHLAIEPAYLDLLAKLGNPHKKLPPVIHVAGTNGKGSTCAFLRAFLESAGHRVHVYTSPHLVRFHERIRIAGELISEPELAGILSECERFAEPGKVSDFEVATAAAFTAFTRHPADAVILEVGMGGRLDATNVIEKSAVTIITRLSYDHTKYLGATLTEIAREKAGIMRAGVPCFAAPQPQEESLESLYATAAAIGAPLSVGGGDWRVEALKDGGFSFIDDTRSLDLPPPTLIGKHQFWNAGLAIAALKSFPIPVADDAFLRGVQTVEWPARLQKITQGALADALPDGWELWLDGGHNDSAA
jgi:dihydrofolate synthase/folylpolyglutamate synthase